MFLVEKKYNQILIILKNKVKKIFMDKNTKEWNGDNIFWLLKPYYLYVIWLLFFTILSNWLNLVIPKIVSSSIDNYTSWKLDLYLTVIEFFIVSFLIFVFTYLQNILQVYTSEIVARDLRNKLIRKISFQDYNYIQLVTPSTLLTNLTSDVDSVKIFVSQAISTIISSVFLIIGASVLLLMINWKMALAVLLIVPMIWISFSIVLSKVRKLFKSSQETIDWLNRIINESILGSALIRLLNSHTFEYKKFLEASTKSKQIWLSILGLFAILVPLMMFLSNIAILIILLMWWHFVILGNMSLGDFAAFNSYLAILIFPIIMIWFMSGVIAQASASYSRISEILNFPTKKDEWIIVKKLSWDIKIENITLKFWEKYALKKCFIYNKTKN